MNSDAIQTPTTEPADYKLWALDQNLNWHCAEGHFASMAEALTACKQRFMDGRFHGQCVETESDFRTRGGPAFQSARKETVVYYRHAK